MKASDLMIGDYVYIKSSDGEDTHIVKVKTIEENGINQFNGFIEFSELEPIPLTHEILEKNGFEIDKNFKNSNYKKNVYILAGCVKWKNDVVFVDFTSEVEGSVLFLTSCKYVHKLQHLLKDLEIEKEIII